MLVPSISSLPFQMLLSLILHMPHFGVISPISRGRDCQHRQGPWVFPPWLKNPLRVSLTHCPYFCSKVAEVPDLFICPEGILLGFAGAGVQSAEQSGSPELFCPLEPFLIWTLFYPAEPLGSFHCDSSPGACVFAWQLLTPDCPAHLLHSAPNGHDQVSRHFSYEDYILPTSHPWLRWI